MYISARLNKKTEKIDVVERVNGKKIFNSYTINYDFYYDDPNGSYRTIYNTPVSKIEPKSSSEFYRELATLSHHKIWESDLNPVFKCLSQHYSNHQVPDLHISFFDIECAFDKEKGFAPINDP